jgi:hypothetical protein
MRWKWIVAIGVLTIVILIAAVYVCLNTDDYDKLKPLIALGEGTGFQIGFHPERGEQKSCPVCPVRNIKLKKICLLPI